MRGEQNFILALFDRLCTYMIFLESRLAGTYLKICQKIESESLTAPGNQQQKYGW